MDQSGLTLRTEKSRVLNRETILRRLVHQKCSFIDMRLQLFHYKRRNYICDYVEESISPLPDLERA